MDLRRCCTAELLPVAVLVHHKDRRDCDLTHCVVASVSSAFAEHDLSVLKIHQGLSRPGATYPYLEIWAEVIQVADFDLTTKMLAPLLEPISSCASWRNWNLLR